MATPTHEYILRLYVAGAAPRSTRAVETVKKACEAHLDGRYRLEVIDVFQQPRLAEREQVLAVPTLIRGLPAPPRRCTGDLSNEERILSRLGLPKRGAS